MGSSCRSWSSRGKESPPYCQIVPGSHGPMGDTSDTISSISTSNNQISNGSSSESLLPVLSHEPPQMPEKTTTSVRGTKHSKEKTSTLPETNIAPKNGGFQYQSPFPGVNFRCYVSFREGNQKKNFQLLISPSPPFTTKHPRFLMTFAKGKLPVMLSTLAPEALCLRHWCCSGGPKKTQHQGPKDHGIAKVFTQWTVRQGDELMSWQLASFWVRWEGLGWLVGWSSWRLSFSWCQKTSSKQTKGKLYRSLKKDHSKKLLHLWLFPLVCGSFRVQFLQNSRPNSTQPQGLCCFKELIFA